MRYLLSFILVGIIFAGCSQDPYDTGDSTLSYLRAEMVDMRVNGQAVVSIVNDEDESLPFPSSMKVAETMARKDTTYRMMLYYNREGKNEIQLVRTVGAAVLETNNNPTKQSYQTDPVTLISVWQSANGRYINLSLGVKTGTSDDKQAYQKLAFVLDSITTNPVGKQTHHITLAHDQSSLPQYYTKNVYMSLPMERYNTGDSIALTINTYQGRYQKILKKQ